MNKEALLAAMDAILAKAEAEGRALTAEEVAEFDRLRSQHDAIDANAERRSNLTALRQASGVRERIERLALAPDQALASLQQYQRPQGNTSRIGDLIRANLGMDGLSADQTRGGSSGFTVPTFLGAEVIDAARAQSRVIQAGGRTIPVQSDTSFATVESDPSFASHGENQSISESEIVFGSRNFQPQTKVCLIRASVELVEDSPTFNNTVDAVLAAAYAVEIDRLALVGSGVGEQWGVLSMDGITEISGAGLSTWAPFARAYQAVRTANFQPGAFITSPGGMGAIDGLLDTLHQPLNPPPSLRAAPILDTTSIPEDGGTTEAVTGEWPLLFLAVRGNGLTIEATRTGGDAMSRLSVLIRAYCRIDSFAVRRAAFAKITGIPVPAIA